MLNLYQRIKGYARMRKAAGKSKRWTAADDVYFEFYRQFISPQDVVFDVGANLGNRAKIFCRLGATVVAVEPQDFCAGVLAAVFKNTPNFHLEKKALGQSAGQAEMLISNAHTISSLSPDWIKSVKTSGRFSDFSWNKTQIVAVDTLDNLIAKYGRPAFIKIDVEGFEHQVIAGLSSPVKMLSMEFVPEVPENTGQCISHLAGLGNYEYQISIGESMEFFLPQWVSAEEIRRQLSAVDPAAFGDVYARLA